MKNKAIISFLLSLCINTALILSASAEINVNMSIDENTVTRSVEREMYGINCEWSAAKNGDFLVFDEKGNMSINPQFGELWKDTMVFARQAGVSSQDIIWKNAIGPLDKRPNQKMWSYQNDKVYLGLVEWLQALYSATPDAEIVYTVNMVTDTIDNMADIVEFLTGDGSVNYNGGENWANVRKSLGIENPVKIWSWELGNELDWAETPRWTPEQYIDYCKKIIPIIKSVDPDGKITCLVNTAAHANGDGWEKWHRAVLRELGDEIDYLAFHYYYPAGYVRRADVVLDRIEQDILDITGSDRIKVIVSEQAPAPNSYTYDKENPYDYCLPHTIWGATAVAEFYLRNMLRPLVVASNCHSINSSVWSIAYYDDEHNLYRTAVGDVIQSFVRYGVGDVLKSELDTYSINESSSIAGAAIRDKDGGINVIFANRYDSEPVTVDFKFADGNYRIKSVRKIHGDVRSADNWYRSGEAWEYNNPDRVEVTEEEISDSSPLLSYTFEPLSVYALALESTDAQISQEQRAQAKLRKFTAFTDNTDSVFVSGSRESISEKYSGANAFNNNGTFLISSEMLAKIFGASLTWDDSGNICTAQIGGRTLIFDMTDGTVTENGRLLEDITPAARFGDRTYFGLRSIAQMLSYSITWDERGFAVTGSGSDAPDSGISDMIYNILMGG